MTDLKSHPDTSPQPKPPGTASSVRSGGAPSTTIADPIIPSSTTTTAASNMAENKWLASTFSLSHVTSEDFYTVAKQQFGLKRYNLSIRCLEIYIARLAAAHAQAQTTAQAVALAPTNSTTTGLANSDLHLHRKLPVGPVHLLAYSHYSLGNLTKSRECFLACVRLGFDSDWQMVIQVEIELSQALKEAAQREEIAGQEAIVTLRKHLQAKYVKQQQQQTNDPSATDSKENPDEDGELIPATYDDDEKEPDDETNQLQHHPRSDSTISTISNVGSILNSIFDPIPPINSAETAPTPITTMITPATDTSNNHIATGAISTTNSSDLSR